MGQFDKAKKKREILQNHFRRKTNIPDFLIKKIGHLAPEKLDVFSNSEECINYFNQLIQFIRSHKNDTELYKIVIDLSEIKYISIDTIMYLIALTQNSSKIKNVKFAIILPKDESQMNKILSTGIHKYINNSNNIEIPDTTDIFYIQYGTDQNTSVAKKACDFTNNLLGTGPTYSKFLYDMLMEMMINTQDHAYNNYSNFFNKQWYLCIENTESVLKFYFLDTGSGIPETMLAYSYTISQAVLTPEPITFAPNDSTLLLQSLKGDSLISRTKLSHRGKGLPEIYAHFNKTKKTSNFKVISGKGSCTFDNANRNEGILFDFKTKFEGTMFYWEIDKSTIIA